MDRLKEAAIETHMNFLADWFPRPSNRAVHHSINEKLRHRDPSPRRP